MLSRYDNALCCLSNKMLIPLLSSDKVIATAAKSTESNQLSGKPAKSCKMYHIA